MSIAVFFGVLTATCLVAALAALWGSLRAAFGGAGGAAIEGIADAPERAALLDEKAALLRAIKDLQYEHQVGKLDQADYERLDRAYRARAKEVLELLDRDVRPYRARAAALLEGAARGAPGAARDVGKGRGKRAGRKGHAAAPPAARDAAQRDGEAAASLDPRAESPPSGEALLGELEALSPEKRAQAEAFLRALAASEAAPGKRDARQAGGAEDEDDETEAAEPAEHDGDEREAEPAPGARGAQEEP